MKIEYEDNQNRGNSQAGKEYNEIFLATCDSEDDRLLFVQNSELVMSINLKGDFVIQAHHDFTVYRNLKRISKLELKAILEA